MSKNFASATFTAGELLKITEFYIDKVRSQREALILTVADEYVNRRFFTHYMWTRKVSKEDAYDIAEKACESYSGKYHSKYREITDDYFFSGISTLHGIVDALPSDKPVTVNGYALLIVSETIAFMDEYAIVITE